ncbi:MAG TPA: TetR/AcrR family transcriptional regulator [Propionicimonas sp.]|nr:TetR/AcrR family transcriptional regulator [Propionicimonas sp.]HRA07151.1 TetR/AcrR family transcriptional regulator [Propionicimonas sp.]
MTAATRPANARQAILDAATELIRVNGVAGTSISDIVASSGTSAGAIYHHFGSKERLVMEVGRSILAAPLARMVASAAHLSPVDLLAAALAHVVEDDRTPELMLQVWAGARGNAELARMVRDESGMMQVGVRTFLAEWCAEHAPDADPDGVLEVTMGLVMGLAVLRTLGMVSDLDVYTASATRMLAALLEPAVD